MLNPDLQAEILSLHFGKKWSLRKIARELGVNRKSVAAVVTRRSVQLGIERGIRKSLLDPYKQFIEQIMQEDPKIPATVLLQRLREQGYPGGYTILKQWVAAKRPIYQTSKKEAFLSIDFAPGECAQVDWGEFGDVFNDGVKIHCFVMVLCYSRLLYLEFTRSEKFEDFIRCHENAFRFFKGFTSEIWYDNLATAVSERRGRLTRFNARFLAYIGHHGIRPYACNQGKGNEKGRVEDGVKYIKSNFWPGRSFKDFNDLTHQAFVWRENIANKREHRVTRKIPELVFEEKEKSTLLALNPVAYDTDEVISKEVSPDYHFVYETNRYSLPWTFVGQVITIRIDDKSLRFLYHDRQVAYHERCYQKHKKFTKPAHEKGLLEIKPQGKSSQNWQIKAVKSLGPALEKYLGFLNASPRSLRYELGKLLALSTVYGADELNQTVAGFLKRGVIGVDHIELALKNKNLKSTKPEPLSFKNGSLARVPPQTDLRRYDTLLFNQNHPADHDDHDGLQNKKDNHEPQHHKKPK